MQVGVAFACTQTGTQTATATDGLAVARANRAAWHVLELLGHIDGVARRVIIDTGASPTAQTVGEFAVVPPAAGAQACDLVIAVGHDMALAAITALRARGGRYVLYLPENPHAGWVEASLFAPDTAFGPVGHHDGVWTLDTFGDQASLLHTLFRCQVGLVPQVWSPSLIEWHDRLHPGPPFALAHAPRAGGMLRCVIDARNASPRAMGILPLLAIERFHAEQRHSVARVEFRHGQALVGHLAFEHLAGGLDVHRQGLLTIWADQDLYAFLPTRADVVVTHSLDGAIGHDLLDTLFGGYRLVHNIPALRHLGYFYPDSDLDRAVAALRAVQRADPARFAADLADVRHRLARFAVTSADAIAAWRRLVVA